MWRSVIFNESFKGRRIIDKKATLRFLQEVSKGLKHLSPSPGEWYEENAISDEQKVLIGQGVILDVFIPALSCANENEEFAKHMAGIIFIKYDDIYDPYVYAHLRSLKGSKKVVNTSLASDASIKNMLLQTQNKEETKEESIVVGSVVEILNGNYKGLIGRVENMANSFCTINVQIFGRSQIFDMPVHEIKLARLD
jgi:transcription antitermination factor NusG